jgi:lipoprotein-releasing system permease protein
MHPLSYLIALRYLTRSAYENTISTMVLISFCGIFIGTFALALVTAIMHGFDIETQCKLQGVHAQATIRAHNDQLNLDALQKVLRTEFPMITASAPTSTAHGLVQKDSEDAQPPAVIFIKAIDPLQEPLVSTLPCTLVPKNSINELTDTTIILGSTIATDHHITIGDTIQLFYAEDNQPKRNKVTFRTYDARVVGFLETGIDECDSSMVLCSFALFDELFPNKGVQEVRLNFAKDSSIPKTIAQLKKRLGLEVYAWQELYPALVSALILEKYVSFVVLALITLVASMNIIALIFMEITAKRTDIALLKALGMHDTDITGIFLLFGIAIAMTAAVCGLLCAVGTSIFIEYSQCVRLPDAYYITYLPARMSWPIPLGVLVLVFIISFLATLIPARKIRTFSIAQTLRFEE